MQVLKFSFFNKVIRRLCFVSLKNESRIKNKEQIYGHNDSCIELFYTKTYAKTTLRKAFLVRGWGGGGCVTVKVPFIGKYKLHK